MGEPMKVERVPIDSISPDPANVRRHGPKNLDAIKGSLRRFGQQKPVVVDGNGIVRAGNGTLEAARALGWGEIDVVRTALAGSEATAFSMADNRSAELAEWDDEALVAQLEALAGEGFDLGEDLGFDADDLADLEEHAAGETVEDEAPPVADGPTRVQPGELWALGAHRLLCGDSTKAEDVARLMGGERAVLMATDPPYGVAYDNAERPNPGVAKPRVAKPRVANDELTDGPAMQAFLERMFAAALPSMDPHAAFYLWHPMLTQGTYVAAAAAAAGILIHRQIIWVKPRFLIGRGDYHWRHELCFYGWQQGNRPPFYGPRNQDTIWEVGSVGSAERKEMDHPTPKPIALWEKPVNNHTREAEIIYEPFSGSGSQLIAAEQLGRRCFAIEIEPRYCDVALARWEKFTGRTAERAP